MRVYINYVFSEIEYDDTMFIGVFESNDHDVFCRFSHNRKTYHTTI